jgi:Fur family transcriptional regulator, ferric uptake regulator
VSADAPRTRAQVAVLAALVDVPTFVSAQELHAQLRQQGQSVGLTTVYRALQVLADAGHVDVLRTPSGEATYRRCGSEQHHHHLVCRECGSAVEVEAPALERWVATIATTHGYVVDGHTLEISGTCSRCSRARR